MSDINRRIQFTPEQTERVNQIVQERLSRAKLEDREEVQRLRAKLEALRTQYGASAAASGGDDGGNDDDGGGTPPPGAQSALEAPPIQPPPPASDSSAELLQQTRAELEKVNRERAKDKAHYALVAAAQRVGAF